MKTRINKAIQSLTCLILAAALLLSGTTGVEASSESIWSTSKWKTVKLNKSAYENVDYLEYKKTATELSEDGKTFTVTFSWRDPDGTVKKSINLKKLLPDDILAKFEDGEIYLYETYDEGYPYEQSAGYKEFKEDSYVTDADYVENPKYTSWLDMGYTDYTNPAKKAKKAAAAYRDKLLAKGIKYRNVKMAHYAEYLRDGEYDYTEVKGKHTSVVKLGKTKDLRPDENGKWKYFDTYWSDEVGGEYIVSWDKLVSSSKGTGTITASSLDLRSSIYEYWSFYLTDKNGKKIIDVKLKAYDYGDMWIDCSLEDERDDDGIIVLKPGESLKFSMDGRLMVKTSYSYEVGYDSALLTVKKDGTIMAKKGKYGIATIYVPTKGIGIRDHYTIFITDGTKKMRKALMKTYMSYDWFYDKDYTLTVKNGKYTIKEIK